MKDSENINPLGDQNECQMISGNYVQFAMSGKIIRNNGVYQ